jgi:hypothetical protein
MDSPIAELALCAAEAGPSQARTTIKSEGTKPKVLPNEDCLSRREGWCGLSLLGKPAFLTAIQWTSRRVSKSGRLYQNCRSSSSCGSNLLGHLKRRCTFNKIRKYRNKAAKPFRISIAYEKQSWKLGSWRIRSRREPFRACCGHPDRADRPCARVPKPGEARSPTLENLGTKLPSRLESAFLMENKAGNSVCGASEIGVSRSERIAVIQLAHRYSAWSLLKSAWSLLKTERRQIEQK